MDVGLLHILNEDKQAARTRIAELEREIQELGPEFYDVFNQSSETWHDNAPFDALRDRQSVLFAELQNLKLILNNSAISIPKIDNSIVGIGAYVVIENTNNECFVYYIAGDWTYRTGKILNGATIISARSPLAKVLIGKKEGDIATFRKTFTIKSIQYS